MDTQVVAAAAAAAAVAGQVCRLCFAGDLQLSSVQGTKSLLKRIFECTSVQITSGEGVDQNAQLCQPCVDRIDDFYAYRALCRTNNDHIRQLVQSPGQQVVTIKQENTRHDLDDEPHHQHQQSSRQQPANEIATKSTPKTKDAKRQPVSLQSNQFLHTDEITIKREALPLDDTDDVYYNSDGDTAAGQQQHQPQSNAKRANYRIIIAANNRERLVYQGFLYCRHFTRRDGSTHWRCRLNGCQAAVNLMLDESIISANNNGHNHAPNAPEELMADIDGGQLGELPMQEGEEEQDGIVDSELMQVEEESLQYSTNKKQGEMLIHLGYRYCKRYQKMDGSTFWKCRANSNKCAAGLFVYPEARVRYHGEHNHDRVVEDGGDEESFVVEGGYTICEDVEDEEDEQEGGEYSEDIAALLSSSLEVMMPEEKKQVKQQYSSADYEITTNVKGRECLIFEGHQYSKDRERVDGAVYWRCRRNYDKCRALAIVMPDGTIEKCGDHLHETDKRHLERLEAGSGSRYYRIIKNQRGNDAFVFEGHRFSKEWSRVDGSIIWRCSYRSGVCRVKVVLNADGHVYRMGPDYDHEHETTEPPVTEEVVLDEDVEFVEESPIRNRPKLIPAAPSASNVPAEVQAAGGYRITRNRKGYEALIHDGYRYCKIRVRQDGSVKWLCKMNKKTCRASVELFPDGSLVKGSEYDHNHERPTDEVEDEEDIDGLPQEVTYPIDPEIFGNSQWYYVKNSKNGMSMIHAGYRYTKKCDRVDGTSLWRCSAAQRGCKAGVILFPNDTLAMVENAEHSHKPYESVRRLETTQEAAGTAPPSPSQDVIEINEDDNAEGDESEMNMHSLLQTVLGADDDPAPNTSAVDNNESVWFNSATDRPYPKPDGPPNFRIIKNRRNTDSLVHRGYRYCKIRDRVDGSILWACQMNKKTCKASVNLTTDGKVEVLNGMHNHVKTDVDDMGGGDEDIGDVQQVPYYPENGADVEPDEPPAHVIEVPPPQLQQPAPKHPDYYYSVNKTNRECLIHRGFRFCKRMERPDGTTSWRCSMGRGTCMATLTIHPDGRPEEGEVRHNHQPLEELPPAVEKMVPVRVEEEEEVKVEAEAEVVTPHKRQGDSLEWNGFHYRKIKELPDGSVIWICQIDSCRVAVKMMPQGQLKMLSESEHNHTAAGSVPAVGPSSSSTVVKPSTVATEGGRSRSYRLFKNQRGQMTLLYDGYRYSIRNRNQDGSSSWKCRANSSCRVIIFLMPDDRIVVGNNNAEHNHEPNWESTRKLEAVAPTRVNPLYDYLNIIPGGQQVKAEAASPVKQQSPDSTNFGRNVIEHKGYYYRLVVRKKNGREYWRCVHFKNRACRAALFCRDTGTIVMSSNGKDHSHGSGAAAKPVPSATPIGGQSKQRPVEVVQPRIEVQPSPPDEVQLTDADEERYIDHGEYVIAKNRKDQNTLIFKDRRYYLSYNRSDGSAVWRCAHRKRFKCYAYVRLRPDGRLLSTGDHEHSHSSATEEPAAPEPQQQQPAETRNYRIVKNRVGNDILIHDSHRFRLNYQRNDGTTHWRCIWARSNHCSAGVYLFPNGMLQNAANEAAIIHNHPPPSQVKKAAAAASAAKVNPPQPKEESKDDVVVVVSSTDEKANLVMDPARTISETEGITDYRFVEEGANKILVCRGYRYWYTWIRKDGSIYYRCTEVKKRACPFGILLLPNGRLIRSSDTCHNHDATSQEEVEEEFLGFPPEPVQPAVPKPVEEEPLMQYPPLVIPEGGDADFKVVKTSRGESLIYKGYRYWAKNRLTNGTVSLCCTRKKMKKCPAMLRLLIDGKVMDPVGMGHTHGPSVEGVVGGAITPALPELPPAITVTPIPRPVAVPVAPAPVPQQLPPLSFNEESDDDCEEGDELINGSKRYSFMKSSAQRNFIVFQGFVYDFEHKQHDGCVFYRCKTSEACPASLMLLTNGRVMAMDDTLHQHDKPDLSGMRPVGRGSKEFKIVQNKNGSNILVHRGHRYTTPRAKTDGAGIWYCHTYIPNVNRRCYVPIELLPNGRVAPVGDKQHDHKPPYKAKPDNAADSDSKDTINGDLEQPQKVGNRMLLLAGHRYNLAQRRDDGAVLWKCARKGCQASMYRLTDGSIINGLEHNHERMESINVKSSGTKRKHSETDRSHNRATDPTRMNPYIGQSIINEGFRYIYYLTRRDGTEHWRCCRRIPLKCRGALLKQQDGTLIKPHDEGHNHPADHTDQPDFIPVASVPPDPAAAGVNESIELDPAMEAKIEDEGSYDYELIDVKGKKRGVYLIHKGAMFVAGHTRRDRARYYRCRTVGCKTAMLLHRNGLLVRSNEHTHDCQNAVKVGDEPPDSKKVKEEEESSEDVVVELPEEEPNGESLDPDDLVVEVKEENSVEAV